MENPANKSVLSKVTNVVSTSIKTLSNNKDPNNIVVLFVEENPLDAKLFEDNLKAAQDFHSYWIVRSKRISQAVKLLARNRFDVIVLDLSQFNTQSLSAVKMLRQTAPKIPIIVLGDKAEDQAIDQFLQCGAEDFLKKDELAGNTLSKAIRFAIERHKILSYFIEKTTHQKKSTMFGLPTSEIFLDRLNHSIASAHRHREFMGLILIDLNLALGIDKELYSHLLNSFSNRLIQSLRENDTVAYLRRGLLAVLLDSFHSTEDVSIVVERLVQNLQLPFTHHDEPVENMMNLGVSIYPHDGVTSLQLISKAHQALKQARQLGKNTFCFHSEDLNVQTEERRDTEKALKNAIETGNLEVFYQAKFDVKTLEPIGLQCLPRWMRSPNECIPASQFIPIIQKSDFICELNKWCFERSCEQATKWKQEGFDLLPISFNLSSHQFFDSSFLDTVNKILMESEIPRRFVSFQISEKSLSSQRPFPARWIHDLQETCVHTILDDFECSTIELDLLRTLKPDQVNIPMKTIDRYLRDEQDTSILLAIVDTCHRLGIKVLAKGVESKEEFAKIKHLGFDFVQGFYIGAVLSPTQATEILEKKIPTPLEFVS